MHASGVVPGWARPTDPEADRVLVDLAEAARRLSISPRSCERLIAERRLRSVKVRGRRLIPTSEIAAFVSRLTESGAGDACTE